MNSVPFVNLAGTFLAAITYLHAAILHQFEHVGDHVEATLGDEAQPCCGSRALRSFDEEGQLIERLADLMPRRRIVEISEGSLECLSFALCERCAAAGRSPRGSGCGGSGTASSERNGGGEFEQEL